MNAFLNQELLAIMRVHQQSSESGFVGHSGAVVIFVNFIDRSVGEIWDALSMHSFATGMQ
jgi:hypothetical protein